MYLNWVNIKSFLACAFLPLVKGLKDPSLTDSYRAVAGSSVILKLFDYVILTVWGGSAPV